MARLQSTITEDGQISIPPEIQEKLGIGPGSVIEWDTQAGQAIVRRAGPYTFEDIHRAVFPDGPPERRTIEEMDEAIGEFLKEKHARR